MAEKELDKLIIIGAGGHGKVCADIAKLMGYRDIVFLDDDSTLTHCGKYPVLGLSSSADKLRGDIFVAVGDNELRRKITSKLSCDRMAKLIHPDAVISGTVQIGQGTVVMAGVVINSDAEIGKGCIINTCSSVDHDCRIGDFVHVSVGSHMSGTVQVGDNCLLGVGSIVKNNICICSNTVIGAGAVVVKNITVKGTYIGIPAQEITGGGDNLLEDKKISFWHFASKGACA